MWQLAVEAGVSYFCVHHIVKGIKHMQKIALHWVPLPSYQSEKVAQVTSPLNGTTMTVTYFDAILQLLTKPRNGCNRPDWNGTWTNGIIQALYIWWKFATNTAESKWCYHQWHCWFHPLKAEIRVLPEVSGESSTFSSVMKASPFHYRCSTTCTAWQCKQSCFKTCDKPSGKWQWETLEHSLPTLWA